MPKLTYFEKLKDPRWQKKRLEVFEACGWACTWCNSKSKTLHVHHLIYRRGAEPWEHSLDDLTALCEACHEEEERRMDEIKEALIDNVDRELIVLLLRTGPSHRDAKDFHGMLAGLTGYLFNYLFKFKELANGGVTDAGLELLRTNALKVTEVLNSGIEKLKEGK